ncbi:exodeoxyribonuclease III [Oecophyllibacter saccharovorans]|uniref:exodeoxyribonuclease III n=1 Tax=Oecophyllibacter saccharovorans TaxID=2558360 RepID=UPI001144D791|nr:exodeoxyribonuclease III [Oecophyllibacter saccharovorans]QDH15623.1 exodeoxyribonuclease III [Oecophyllibacter saccharovorans]
MALTFATWNINSIRVRSGLVKGWLDRNPDCTLLGLQEVKCEDGQFPEIFAQAGLHTALVGQKGYNGVAFISRRPLEITCRALPGFEDPAARYIEAELEGIRFGNLYLPNGNSGGEAGYATKLAFFAALRRRALAFLQAGQPFVFMGDFNVCPTDADCAPNALEAYDALKRPQTREAFRRLLWVGLTDAWRALHPDGRAYTFWDYQGASFARDSGLRIDLVLLSPQLADRLVSVHIDRDERALERPSDHVPVSATLNWP